MMFWISSGSVGMSPFSFLIVLIRILSLCPLVSLKEPATDLVVSLNSSFCFYLVDFAPEIDDFLKCTPHG
jgi:hypothetical protein